MFLFLGSRFKQCFSIYQNPVFINAKVKEDIKKTSREHITLFLGCLKVVQNRKKSNIKRLKC